MYVCMSVRVRLTIDELVEDLIKIPLVCQPGEMFYYGWSYDVSTHTQHTTARHTGGRRWLSVLCYHVRLHGPSLTMAWWLCFEQPLVND